MVILSIKSTAEVIRVAMAREKMTAKELSEKSEVSQPTISRILSGESHYNTDNLYKIVDALYIQTQ